ncbi:MAG: hypothetical protein WC451_04120 [Patescibacteria group bacterium]|jgi:hypothetical protein
MFFCILAMATITASIVFVFRFVKKLAVRRWRRNWLRCIAEYDGQWHKPDHALAGFGWHDDVLFASLHGHRVELRREHTESFLADAHLAYRVIVDGREITITMAGSPIGPGNPYDARRLYLSAALTAC